MMRLSKILSLGFCIVFAGSVCASSSWAVDDKAGVWGSPFTERGHLAFEDPPNPQDYAGIEPSSGAADDVVVGTDDTENEAGETASEAPIEDPTVPTYGAENEESNEPVIFE